MVKLDDEKVMKALKDSRSEWLVKKMANGLDSKVGRLFEGGMIFPAANGSALH
jgi:hypothetical protein